MRLRPDKLKAFIDVEGNCGPLSADDVSKAFVKVPMLAVFGDNTVGAAGPNGDDRRNSCVTTAEAIRKAGGTAKFLLLPEAGIKGTMVISSPSAGGIAAYANGGPCLVAQKAGIPVKIFPTHLPVTDAT